MCADNAHLHKFVVGQGDERFRVAADAENGVASHGGCACVVDVCGSETLGHQHLVTHHDLEPRTRQQGEVIATQHGVRSRGCGRTLTWMPGGDVSTPGGDSFAVAMLLTVSSASWMSEAVIPACNGRSWGHGGPSETPVVYLHDTVHTHIHTGHAASVPQLVAAPCGTHHGLPLPAACCSNRAPISRSADRRDDAPSRPDDGCTSAVAMNPSWIAASSTSWGSCSAAAAPTNATTTTHTANFTNIVTETGNPRHNTSRSEPRSCSWNVHGAELVRSRRAASVAMS